MRSSSSLAQETSQVRWSQVAQALRPTTQMLRRSLQWSRCTCHPQHRVPRSHRGYRPSRMYRGSREGRCVVPWLQGKPRCSSGTRTAARSWRAARPALRATSTGLTAQDRARQLTWAPELTTPRTTRRPPPQPGRREPGGHRVAPPAPQGRPRPSKLLDTVRQNAGSEDRLLAGSPQPSSRRWTCDGKVGLWLKGWRVHLLRIHPPSGSSVCAHGSEIQSLLDVLKRVIQITWNKRSSSRRV